MQYVALVLSIIGATVFFGLLLAAICSYYWISQKRYPCAWSATADAKSDVYYKKTSDWKYVQSGGAVPDVEEGVITDNDEPLLGSIVLEDGANAAAHAGQRDAADATTDASTNDGGAPSPFNGRSESRVTAM